MLLKLASHERIGSKVSNGVQKCFEFVFFIKLCQVLKIEHVKMQNHQYLHDGEKNAFSTHHFVSETP